MAQVPSGLLDPKPPEMVIFEIVTRSRSRLEAMGDAELLDLLQDAVYSERRRLERADPVEGEEKRLDALASAVVRGDRHQQIAAALDVVGGWADEIHGRFHQRIYEFASRVMPRALTGLLSARPQHLWNWDLSPDRRIEVTGETQWLRELVPEATLILVPTHVSNLDSPILGLSLYQAGLPPFVYGAGLNLFSNPMMGWWLRRLGAYTVDRTKQARLYKEVLKDYSVRCLSTRHHSLFFPGGTRARSGAIETRLKKGLLGTGIIAWQEMLEAGRADPEIYVVPMTLSYQQVLEASTLIDDHLAEVGKQRYIISDDEAAKPREVGSFARRILDLDSAVVARYGAPVDLLGFPVPRDRVERLEAAARRRRYVCDASGKVVRDAQRDHVYTERLGKALVEAYPKLATLMSTHLVADAGWRFLEDAGRTRDPFRLVRVDPATRRIPRPTFLKRLERLCASARAGAAAGKWHEDLPGDAQKTLELALDRFSRYHKTRAVTADGNDVVIEDPKLCLYYRNRATFAELEDR